MLDNRVTAGTHDTLCTIKNKKLTKQSANQVILKEETFNLVDFDFTNKELTKPQDFGITPKRIASFCWRGYITTYKVDSDSNFILNKLMVYVDTNDEIKLVNNVAPISSKTKSQKRIIPRVYEEINLPLNYSGFILLTKDFIEEFYLQIGLHRAWKYKTVYEIEIDKGLVKSIIDLSRKGSEIRDSFQKSKGTTKKNNPPTEKEISKWLENSFNQKYQKKKK